MILTVRTDNPQAEVGLYDSHTRVAYKKWHAHRELSNTIHSTIKELLISVNIDWSDLSGVVYYKGPGSFTGLRIGGSLVNALTSVNQIPVCNRNGSEWIEDGIKALLDNRPEALALPEYGSEPHTTSPKKLPKKS